MGLRGLFLLASDLLLESDIICSSWQYRGSLLQMIDFHHPALILSEYEKPLSVKQFHFFFTNSYISSKVEWKLVYDL